MKHNASSIFRFLNLVCTSLIHAIFTRYYYTFHIVYFFLCVYENKHILILIRLFRQNGNVKSIKDD